MPIREGPRLLNSSTDSRSSGGVIPKNATEFCLALHSCEICTKSIPQLSVRVCALHSAASEAVQANKKGVLVYRE
jgi:hypothetical protein